MAWLRRLANTFRTGRLRRDIDRELSFHVAERQDALRTEGLSDGEARRRARLQIGNPAVQVERTRDVDVSGALDGLLRNIRYALRALRRAPGFTVTVVLTLALGIGANSAVFSAIDAVLLRPLAFPDGDRLVRLSQVQEGPGETGIAPVRLADWNRLSSTFTAITGYFPADVVDTTGALPERTRVGTVAPGFFDVVGVRPALGRLFSGADYQFGGPTVIVLSDRIWRARGADRGVVGRRIQAEGSSITPVGILPPTFQFPGLDVDIWSANADAPWMTSRQLTWYIGIGRLKPGVTLDQARADLERVQTQLATQYPDTDRGIGVRIEPLKETVVGDARGSLWVLFGAVSVLLLIACTNIAALMLSRAARRAPEIAVRYSLGGSHAAIAAQVLTETAVLAAAGAAIGLAVAVGATRALRFLAPDLPRVNEVAIDTRIILYTAVATVVVALLCGVLPAFRSTSGAGRLSGATRTQVFARHSVQWLLVGVQVALSVTLLAGAGLLLRSVDALSRVDTGFDSSHVLTLRVSGSYGTETTDARVQRLNRVLDELDALPDIEASAITSLLPGVPDHEQLEFTLAEGRAASAPRIVAESRVVSPSYFATMGLPMLTGELCRRSPDAGGNAGVTTEVMVNRRFVEQYMQGGPAIGRHLRGGLDYLVKNRHLAAAPPARIAGVVGDARELGADRDPVPTVYTCFSAPNPAPWILARTTGPPLVTAAAVRRKIQELEPRRAVYDVTSLEQRIGDAYRQNRLRTWLLTLFALTALALACAGVYGTLSYAVGLRRREVALRLALGAPRGDVVRTLMSTSIRVVGIATAAGLVLAMVFTRGLSAMLYGVSPTDPATLSSVVGLVLAVAALAALVPAARAAFVQPMRVLRDE